MSSYENKVKMLYSSEELEELKKNCEYDNGEYRSDLLLTYLNEEKIEESSAKDKGEYRCDILNYYLKQDIESVNYYTSNNCNSLLLKKNELIAKDMEDAMLVPCTNYISLDDTFDNLL